MSWARCSRCSGHQPRQVHSTQDLWGLSACSAMTRNHNSPSPPTGQPEKRVQHLLSRGFFLASPLWPMRAMRTTRRTQIPLDALVNDNWIGREKINVREATVATKTLLSLGRACWKQVRLGRGKPDVQQKAICGNTIFFAQPTADIPSMELPPPTDALIDSFNLILTRNLDDLRYAQWATVNRAEYMILAGQRKKECATFAHASLREDLAKTRLPEAGGSRLERR